MSARLLCTTLFFGLIVSACGQPDQRPLAVSVAEEIEVNDPVEDVVPVAVTQSNTVHYACTPNQDITVTYSTQDATQPKANLVINNVSYDMYAVVAASGARYATEQGIEPEQGMQWHTKGESGILISMTLDHTADPEDERILLSCTEKMTIESNEN